MIDGSLDPMTVSLAQTALLAGILIRQGTLVGTVEGLKDRVENTEGQLSALRARIAEGGK